ncbi:unnamed protein product [Eretmochelys imbricata]
MVARTAWVPILHINPLLFLMAVVSLWAPSVYISPPHTEDLALRELATITCLSSGFRPRAILVTWTQQDWPVPQEAYTNIGPVGRRSATSSTASSMSWHLNGDGGTHTPAWWGMRVCP